MRPCLFLSLALALCLPAPARAECRLALALAVDVSRSVDAADYVIQTEGLADALIDPAVQEAIFGVAGTVAIMVYYWSGVRHQEVVADWRVIRTPAELTALSDQVRAMPRLPVSLPTALGEALRFGQAQFEAAPACARQVLDVAGDGRNNEGISPRRIYEKVDFGSLVVNGLAVGEHESGLAAYYASDVIRGPGAFVELAPSQADYPRSIRRKLLRELVEAVSTADPAGDLPEGRVFLTSSAAPNR